MHTLQQLQEIVALALSNESFSGQPKELYQPIQYIMQMGGKRLRPTLALMAGEMYQCELEKIIRPALALEIFHNFTLVHDDIMDAAPIRRGKETIYKKWNTNIAILSGDTMFAVAYNYLTDIPPHHLPAALKVFNQTAIEVCEGQQYDLNFEDRSDVTIPEYLNMIRLKTAVLLAASLKIGAILADAPAAEADLLYRFGEDIGMAFQLKDDLLDAFGDESVFGKKTGGDIVTNKKTFLNLKALDLAEGNDRDRLNHYFSSTTFDPQEKVAAVLDIYKKLKIKEATEDLMDKYYQSAMSILDQIDVPQERKTLLKSFADKLQDRVH